MKIFSFDNANFNRQFLNGLDWSESESVQFTDEEGSPMDVWFMEGSDLDYIIGNDMLQKITDCANALKIEYGESAMETLVWMAMKYRGRVGSDFIRLVFTEIN